MIGGSGGYHRGILDTTYRKTLFLIAIPSLTRPCLCPPTFGKNKRVK